jgi:O-acetyl-ADP-ribose deacetylase (regulator of RNase III)
MIEIVRGNIIDSTEKYIGHICNCLTQTPAGAAKAIFDKYPYANTYAERTEPDVMSTIKILGDGQDQRYVINMFAQYYPGRTKYPNSQKDGIKTREKAFYHCLLRVAEIENLESIAFPWRIGCNLAGGDWEHYLGKLHNFAKYVSDKHNTIVRVYRRLEDE